MRDDALAADTAALVDELRTDIEHDAAAVGRLRERLAVSLTLAPLPHSNGATRPVEPSSPAPASPGARLLSSKVNGLALLALGVGLGAGGHALLETKHERIVDRSAPALPAPAKPGPAGRPSLPPNPLEAVSASADPVRAPVVRSRPSSHVTASASAAVVVDEGVDGEVRLLDVARSAIAAQQGERALSLLRLHAQRYPHGALEQERAALGVKALVETGRITEARQAAKRFAELYPNSMLLDSVNASLRGIP